MDYIKNFNYSAILLIYPDGTVDYELIDHRLLHLEYYIDLNKKSAKLNEVIMTNQIDIPESINDTENGFTWQIDTDLAMNGVIAFHNLFITEIYSDRGYAEDMPSTFYVSLPSKLTDAQKVTLNRMCSNYDLSCSLFGRLYEDYLDDIKYEDFYSMLDNKKTL